MSLNETALACLNRNRLLYLNMLEVLRRGSAELLYAGEGGVLPVSYTHLTLPTICSV